MERAGPDFGRTLDSASVERGLLELCPDLHFDLAGAIGQLHPFINERQGVYYRGRHICSMDRGSIPEYKIWGVRTETAEVSWYEADKEGASMSYVRLNPDEPGYRDLYEKARKGSDPSLLIAASGRLLRLKCVAQRKVPGRVVRVGWRHTFERLIQAGVPGITRQSLAEKFAVDMLKYPVGSPDEVVAALVQE